MNDDHKIKALAQQLEQSPFFPLLRRLEATLKSKWDKETLVKDTEFETLKAVIRREERNRTLDIFFQELESLTH